MTVNVMKRFSKIYLWSRDLFAASDQVIKTFYQDLEVWEYLNSIPKESSESLTRWTVIEKRVCSERTPSISNMLDTSRGPTPFGSWPIFCQNLEQSRDVSWIYSTMIAENQGPACFRSFRRSTKNEWYLATPEAMKVFLSLVSFITHCNPD
jgi:hypothetical protein